MVKGNVNLKTLEISPFSPGFRRPPGSLQKVFPIWSRSICGWLCSCTCNIKYIALNSTMDQKLSQLMTLVLFLLKWAYWTTIFSKKCILSSPFCKITSQWSKGHQKSNWHSYQWALEQDRPLWFTNLVTWKYLKSQTILVVSFGCLLILFSLTRPISILILTVSWLLPENFQKV